MTIPVSLKDRSYDIVLEAGSLGRAAKLLNLNRKVLIVTDEGVPAKYADCLAAQCLCPVRVCVPEGEKSKSIEVWRTLLERMMQAGFTRKDCVAAVGGGVVGDLAGFAAASYMRGIDFYNVPTTVLSQVDSSIGGKTGLDLNGIKNVLGAFYQPRRVLIDPECLSTLPKRQIANGLAEALKMAATSDAALFERFLKEDILAHPETVIEQAIRIKTRIVETDEREVGIRRILNFGHTVGHAIESMGTGLYHGECVALGMLPMCAGDARERLMEALERLGLPARLDMDAEKLLDAIGHDKKRDGENILAVTVERIGEGRIVSMTPAEIARRIEDVRGLRR